MVYLDLKHFFVPPAVSPHPTVLERHGCRLQEPTLKQPQVYLNLLFGLVEGGWRFLLLESPAGNITPLS